MCGQHINIKCYSFLFFGSSWFLREPKTPSILWDNTLHLFPKNWPLASV